METILLEKSFTGKGEVSGTEFNQIHASDKAYIYELYKDGAISYEVIKRKSSGVCIDFDKKIFSKNHLKESYPKSTRFGVDGWAFRDIEAAKAKFNELS